MRRNVVINTHRVLPALGLLVAGNAFAQPVTIDSADGSVGADSSLSCQGSASCMTTTSGTPGFTDLLIDPAMAFGITAGCAFPPPSTLTHSITAIADGSFAIPTIGAEILSVFMWGATSICNHNVFDIDCDVDAEGSIAESAQFTCVTDVTVFGHLDAGGADTGGCTASISLVAGSNLIVGAGTGGADSVLINNAFPAGTVLTVSGFATTILSGNARDALAGCDSTCQQPGYTQGFSIDATFDEYCLPDANKNGSVEQTDFTAWINAFNMGDILIADQNGDGQLTSTDFTAFLANYARGCPW